MARMPRMARTPRMARWLADYPDPPNINTPNIKEFHGGFSHGLPAKEGASASKQQGEKSSLITILFSSTSLYYFENSARLKSLWANKSSIRQGDNRPKEPNSYSTIGISPKLQPQKYTMILSVRSLK